MEIGSFGEEEKGGELDLINRCVQPFSLAYLSPGGKYTLNLSNLWVLLDGTDRKHWKYP